MKIRIPPVLRLLWRLFKDLWTYPVERMTEPRYNPTKFKELLVYVASRTSDDPKCGDMKLNKLLYFADVTAFRKTGQPISGAKYQHQRMGPIAEPLLPARRDLVREGRLAIGERDYEGYVQKATEAKSDIRSGVLEPEELAIVDEVIARFRDFDGRAMEDVAHEEPGWRMTSEGEKMPYRLSLVAKKASPRAISRGKELAERFGW